MVAKGRVCSLAGSARLNVFVPLGGRVGNIRWRTAGGWAACGVSLPTAPWLCQGGYASRRSTKPQPCVAPRLQPKRPRSEGVAVDGLRSSRALACSRVHRAAIALLDQLPPRLVALGEASRYPRLRVECRPQVTRRAPAGARSAPLLGPPRDGTCRLATVRHSLNAPSSNPLSGTRAAA